MSITASDVKLFASERLNDEANGGGFMTGTVIVDGVENNLFPDISTADRTFGRVQLRKIYLAVTSSDTDTFLGAHAIVDEVPADAAVNCLLVTKAGYDQERGDLVSALDNSSYKVPIGAVKRILGAAVLTPGVSNAFQARYNGSVQYSYWNGTTYVDRNIPGDIQPGDIVGLFAANEADPIPDPASMDVLYVATAGSDLPGPGSLTSYTTTQPVTQTFNRNLDVTYNSNFGTGYSAAPDPSDWMVKLEQDVASGALKFYGQTVTTAPLIVGDDVLPVVSTFQQYIPVGDGGAYPSVDPSILGVDPAGYAATAGRVKVFRKDEAIVVHHTQTSAPMTVVNAQVVNLGRPRVAEVKVFDSNGDEITTNFTVNKTAGTVTFVNVAGYAQPITIRDRIEDMLLVSEAAEQSITVGRAVTHAFPSGSKVSSVVFFGDLQARVNLSFQQTTWTGVWSDTRIGDEPLADFNEPAHPLVVTNAGALTERWAVIFTNSTSFRVVGEQVGEVVTNGATAVDCSPLNPATGVPYFTIPATGWGNGWATGNVYRFNTKGANAPLWVIRSVQPSDPYTGPASVTVALRGNVNA